MMQILLGTVLFLSVIFILVLVHELGHFLVARWFGIKVQRFSIGFGKPFWRVYDRKGTEYALAPIPLGGYVKLLDSREETVAAEDLPFAFDGRPLHQRFLVLIAGSVFNLIFAVLAFWVVFTAGIFYLKPIIGTVALGSIAAQAGVQPGDQWVSIERQIVPHWSAVNMALISRLGDQKQLDITVKRLRNEQHFEQPLRLDLSQWRLDALRPDPLKSLGISPYRMVTQTTLQKWQYAPGPAFLAAVREVYTFGMFNLTMLHKLFTGVISLQGLGGPFSIFEGASGAAAQGLVVYIQFLGLMSISIAIINLLPIPGLDGGQLLYTVIEMVRGRALSSAAQLLAFRLGVIALSLLLIQVVLNDLTRRVDQSNYLTLAPYNVDQ